MNLKKGELYLMETERKERKCMIIYNVTVTKVISEGERSINYVLNWLKSKSTFEILRLGPCARH